MATALDGRWHAGIGDPSLLGWVTVGAYGLAAVLSVRAAVRARDALPELEAHGRRLVVFWGMTAVAMVLLGINKQLDLQTWFTQVARDLSRAQGWYGNRRFYQVAFIIALTCAGALGTITLAFVLRRILDRIGVAVAGLGVLVTFVVIRAASFHRVDALLLSGPLPLNRVAELGSLVLIALNAWFAGLPLSRFRR